MSDTGERKNSNKLRWRNFPLFLMEPLVQVAAEGEKKYDTFNFMKGLYVNDSMDSLKRHLMKLESPLHPDADEESHISHAAHVAWNALIICYTLKYRKDLDDRFKYTEEQLKTMSGIKDESN